MGIMGMTRAVWVGQARVWVGHGLSGLIARNASACDYVLCAQLIKNLSRNYCVQRFADANASFYGRQLCDARTQ